MACEIGNFQNKSLDWYISGVEKRISNYSACLLHAQNHPHYYLPGASVMFSDVKSLCTEMWSYQINKKYNVLKIESLCPEVEINRIIINGSPVNSLSGKYAFESISNLDVVVEYTVDGVQSMTTHYDKDFNASLPDTDFSLVKEIVLNSNDMTLYLGEISQISANVLPENVENITLIWMTSDESIATVDANGKVTAVGIGEATITVTAADGSGVSASCHVTVMPTLGDSNANGTVNIADAVNTANYAVGNEVENFCFAAADVNADGEITVADASGTVTIILAQPVQESRNGARSLSALQPDGADCLTVSDYSAVAGETTKVCISLDNSIDYVALQADIILPEGLTLQSVAGGIRAAGHTLTTRQIDSRRVRVVLFDPGNSAFVDSRESLLELKVRANSNDAGDIVIEDIIASDASANEYRLASAGGHSNVVTGTDRVPSENVRVEAADGSINIYNAIGSTIAIYGADGRVLARFVAKNEAEQYKTASGLYIVAVGNRMVKVLVKSYK